MKNVTYQDGVAVVIRGSRKTEVSVHITAVLALDGGVKPNMADLKALAAGYLAVIAERDDLLKKLAAVGSPVKQQEQPAASPKPIPVPKDAKLWGDGIWRDSSGNTLGPAASPTEAK